ncbi:CapA family protein [Cognaticolwellia beringensis]|uniref:Capsule synthesis protein CapA domain-containing protein n=1 Tax=Cognaticolwellia beringensis TaxID=1967665 RepID=A0A222G9W6_9GAMM|nr:CapA family protein [Cognaticolwellia beringensis]ASP48590.1 hypothetical protein B5D82_12905 [Cognaticolwellia beringensis]
MIIRIKTIAFLAIISFIFASNTLLASVLIEGRLVSESQEPISKAVVSLSNINTKTDENGFYQIKVPIADIYQLNFTKQGFYSSIQTFSHYELNKRSPSLQIADVALVEKTDSRVLLAFGGDTMMGRRFYNPYFGDSVLINDNNRLADSRAIVENIKPYMSLADFATANLETQVFNKIPGDSAPKSVSFFSKPEILDALSWAGIDYVTLGNNHTYDFKKSGLDLTLKHLRRSTLGFSGAGIDEEQALAPYRTKLNGVDYSMLGYVGWEGSVSPNQVAEKNKGGAAFGTTKNILKSVNKELNAGHIPIVQYHGSQEYSNNPTGVTEQRLKSAIDAGASLAVAHHPHVAQGLELYNNKLIAYSMGNFVFDQYIPSTPYSFILYVWMDKGEFHRAELVPLYLKGYKPTPATGINRYTVMKRLSVLSEQRNTLVTSSGGHGVITRNAKSNEPTDHKLSFSKGTQVAPLYAYPWEKKLSRIQLPKSDLSYRLGINLVNGSDFESITTFDSKDRSWMYDREKAVINNYGASGSKSLGIKLSNNEISELGMQGFKRVYKASNPTTVVAKVKTSQPAKISFYWQGRKTRDKFFQAREEGKKHLIGSFELSKSDNWKSLEVDFNSPRIGYRSYRLLATVELLDGSTGQIDIDDLALVEWQTAFSKVTTLEKLNVDAMQASYIGLNKTPTQPIMLTIK